MVVTTDTTNSPWIHHSGTMAEVLAEVKKVNGLKVYNLRLFYNGTNQSAVYKVIK